MSFLGAPNVLYVSKNGNNTTGDSWATAKSSLSGAISAVSANSLILVAPGEYVNSDAIATISSTHALTIRGAPGACTQLTRTTSGSLITVESNNLVLEDLVIENASSHVDGAVRFSETISNVTFRRCFLAGEKAVQAKKCKGLRFSNCTIVGRQQALLVGNITDSSVELFDCIIDNSIIRVENSGNTTVPAIEVDGGCVTAMSTDFSLFLTGNGGSATFTCVKLTDGSAFVATNCKFLLGESPGNTGGQNHYAIDASQTSTRLVLTGGLARAFGGASQNAGVFAGSNTSNIVKTALLET